MMPKMAPDAPALVTAGFHRETGEAARQTADEVHQYEIQAAVDGFRERSHVQQSPHVEQQVNDADVQEHAGEQPPPLVIESVWSEICSPAKDLIDGGIGGRDAAKHHRKKYKDVGANENAGESTKCVPHIFPELPALGGLARSVDARWTGSSRKLFGDFLPTLHARCHSERTGRIISSRWRAHGEDGAGCGGNHVPGCRSAQAPREPC